MTWIAPMTAVANTVLTAADWNMFIRDNLNETMPAKATTTGRHFATTGPHRIAERRSLEAVVTTTGTTDSQSFTDLNSPGPAVTVATGIRAWVFIGARISNATSGQNAIISFGVDGATDIEPITARGAHLQSMAADQLTHATSATTVALNPGNNTFTMRYRVSGGTGTFLRRRIFVVAL